MSIRLKMVYAILKIMGIKKKMANSDESMGENKEKIKASQKLNLKMEILSNLLVEESLIEGRKIYRIKRDDKPKKQALIYLFGGGFVAYPTNFDLKFIKAILKELDIEIILPIYPLAPDHKLNEIIDFTNRVYEELLREYESKQISILGFSAGASLAIYILNYRKQKNMEEIYPKQLILSSPLGEYPFGESTIAKMKEIEPIDPIFTVSAIEKLCEFVEDAEFPGQVSTNTHDMKNFPPIKLIYGEREIFRAFTGGYKRAASKYNLDIDYIVERDSMHCSPLLLMTPEGKRGFKKIINYLK
ncbi:MAG: alpha/beta hydrolase [Tissierellia bacterium]|nr:alpha/beta hydrolase [Tissierellia bacterium]